MSDDIADTHAESKVVLQNVYYPPPHKECPLCHAHNDSWKLFCWNCDYAFTANNGDDNNTKAAK